MLSTRDSKYTTALAFNFPSATHTCARVWTSFWRQDLYIGLSTADFGTGVYHWSVDNYGSGATPIVGDQIAAFQGHHQRPWTITQRQFANNLHKVKQDADRLIVQSGAPALCYSMMPANDAHIGGIYLPSVVLYA